MDDLKNYLEDISIDEDEGGDEEEEEEEEEDMIRKDVLGSVKQDAKTAKSVETRDNGTGGETVAKPVEIKTVISDVALAVPKKDVIQSLNINKNVTKPVKVETNEIKSVKEETGVGETVSIATQGIELNTVHVHDSKPDKTGKNVVNSDKEKNTDMVEPVIAKPVESVTKPDDIAKVLKDVAEPVESVTKGNDTVEKEATKPVEVVTNVADTVESNEKPVEVEDPVTDKPVQSVKNATETTDTSKNIAKSAKSVIGESENDTAKSAETAVKEIETLASKKEVTESVKPVTGKPDDTVTKVTGTSESEKEEVQPVIAKTLETSTKAVESVESEKVDAKPVEIEKKSTKSVEPVTTGSDEILTKPTDTLEKKMEDTTKSIKSNTSIPVGIVTKEAGEDKSNTDVATSEEPGKDIHESVDTADVEKGIAKSVEVIKKASGSIKLNKDVAEVVESVISKPVEIVNKASDKVELNKDISKPDEIVEKVIVSNLLPTKSSTTPSPAVSKNQTKKDQLNNDIDALLEELNNFDDSDIYDMLLSSNNEDSTTSTKTNKNEEKKTKKNHREEYIKALHKLPLQIFTSLAGGGYGIMSRTNRLILICKGNGIDDSLLQVKDLGTDVESKRMWQKIVMQQQQQQHSSKKPLTLPALIRSGDDDRLIDYKYIGNWESIDTLNEEGRFRAVLYDEEENKQGAEEEEENLLFKYMNR